MRERRSRRPRRSAASPSAAPRSSASRRRTGCARRRGASCRACRRTSTRRSLAAADRLVAARPTAVNLAWAVARMRGVALATAGGDAEERVLLLEAEADLIAAEDRAACAEIGRLGAAWLRARFGAGVPTVLTHCNAGALATAGIGTALGIVRALAADGGDRDPRGRDAAVPPGRAPHGVGAREGRPARHAPPGRRGGRRSSRAGASTRSSSARTASPRTATSRTRSGRTASRSRRTPTACRSSSRRRRRRSTLATPDGAAIPIEERDGAEVVDLPLPGGGTVSLAPAGVTALYPAFDVTPAALVDAIVTERGISERPHAAGLARLLAAR